MGRKKADINSVRELILTLTREGISQEEILEEVNAQLVAQDQRTISLRTLQRYLQEWSLDRTDPESVRELIQTLLQDGCHQDEILEEVNTQLVAQNQQSFDYLAKYALFIEGNLVDQIALYAVYGPLIRDHFAHFVQSWNTRPIHAPRAGGQVVTGTPAEIYLTHTAGNWGVPFGQSGDADDRIALTQMLDPLQSVDTQAFLSLETGDWCNIQLQRMGYLEAEVAECTQRCLNSYLQLRQLIQQHQDSNAQPILRLAPVPPGDSGELIRLLQQNAEVELTGGIGLRGDPITPEYLDQIRQFEAEEMESMIS
ncbi:hypothetical protein E4U22_008115 [Claviceps purpurea]|uniref:Uncharacterized protein n=1 Tax=Claviceps purpurea (strain 20.1) TaxID=1111077 RepID=M1WAB8_CLAP2|nr:hypothetical protein E4U22_008115 [Claviceps purpurea]CCE27609.1 uncharacterized protein CPUR_01083 [Claviceps purpurea 20.1]